MFDPTISNPALEPVWICSKNSVIKWQLKRPNDLFTFITYPELAK